MKFSILVDDDFYEKIRKYAFRKKIKFAEAVRVLLKMGLEK